MHKFSFKLGKIFSVIDLSKFKKFDLKFFIVIIIFSRSSCIENIFLDMYKQLFDKFLNMLIHLMKREIIINFENLIEFL